MTQQMQHVLLVSTEPFESTWAYYSLGILDALKKKGIPFIFIYLEGDKNLEHLITDDFLSIKIHKKKTKIGRIIQKFYPIDFLRTIKKICNNHPICIIHFLSPDYIITNIINSLKKLAYVIYTVHDAIPHDYKLKGVYEHLFAWYLYHHVQKNIKKIHNLATNSVIQMNFLKKKFPHKNVFYFRMPSHITETIRSGMVYITELPPKTKDYILFFGSIHIYKGIDILIKAFQQCSLQNNAKLVIAGAGSYCPKEIYYVNNIIFIHRHIKDEEVRSLFENARCVVYPYTSITQTAVVQFPYYFKVPVIASDLEYFKDCIIDRKTGFLFKNGNVEHLTKILEYVCSNAFDPEPMKKAMAEQFQKCYSEEGLAEELIKIYQNFNSKKDSET